MKLKFNVLAGAVISSVVTLSAFAQYAPVRDGSNASRAPLPANRPNDFVRVTHYTPNGSLPLNSVLVATHIGGPTPNQFVAVNERARPTRLAVASANVPARAVPTATSIPATLVASAQRE